MRNFICLALRCLIALVFILSGFTKLIEPPEIFLKTLLGYQIVYGNTAIVIAFLFPWIEFIVGVFFLFGLWTRQSLLCLWAANSVFIAAIVSLFWRKISLESCGCFGENLIRLTPSQVLLMDLALWMIFLFLFLNSKGSRYMSLDESTA